MEAAFGKTPKMKDISIKGCLAVLGTPVVLVILVIGFFWLSFHDVHVRYRLTVEVQDGDQIKTGSSVIDASYSVQPDWSWSGPGAGLSSLTGYAPTVDLGEKGMLFLTFESVTRTPDNIRARNRQFFCANDDIWCLPFAAYGKPGTGVATGTQFSEQKAALDELLRQSGPRDVPFAMLPELARFRDINESLSLTPISLNNLSASFGPGVALKRVILQLTDDRVTPPPGNWPKWLKEKGQMSGKLRGYPND
ncbi:hypothetical protein SAMN05443247_07650 [Bradyrhizobium erythrophlei]|jgi:hypothetical protein|nr:hypothetical protein SAMN05443247_07650 [Bradyrhizobium erythrophlei]